MADLDKIRAALQDRVVSVVAEQTGLSRVTIAGIKTGKSTGVSKKTLLVLAYYLDVKDDK